ncbi:unnamed protein product, partial [Urochloa humidicola]
PAATPSCLLLSSSQNAADALPPSALWLCAARLLHPCLILPPISHSLAAYAPRKAL